MITRSGENVALGKKHALLDLGFIVSQQLLFVTTIRRSQRPKSAIHSILSAVASSTSHTTTELGRGRVMFYNGDGRLVSIMASWIDADAPDSFAQAAAGRSWLRTDDLRRLRSQVDELMAEIADHVE
ncbi:DUF5372 family protein [Paraburkholderia sprentiae]